MYPFQIADQQLQRGVAASVQTVLLGSDGEPDTTASSVTVDITRADGTVLVTAGAASAVANQDGAFSYALTAAQLATLDVLALTWKVGTVLRASTTVEVVGGYYFTPVEAKTYEPSITANAADIKDARRQVESECERICGVAFVPRYRRVWLDGTGTSEILLPTPLPRRNTDGSAAVRSVRVYSDPTTYVVFDATELAALDVSASGLLIRRDLRVFPLGGLEIAVRPFGARLRNIVIEYEHGYDRPPPELKRRTIRRCRQVLNLASAALLDRAQTFTSSDTGATYRLNTPDDDSTGDAEIDAVYARYAWAVDSIGVA